MDYKKRLTEKQRERFAFMLRYKRLERDLTITELADKLGYSITSISYWEKRKQIPTYTKYRMWLISLDSH